MDDGFDCGKKSIGHGEDLFSRFDPDGFQSEMKGGCSGIHADSVAGSRVLRELLFKRFHVGAQHEMHGGKNVIPDLMQLFPDLVVLGPDIHEFDLFIHLYPPLNSSLD